MSEPKRSADGLTQASQQFDFRLFGILPVGIAAAGAIASVGPATGMVLYALALIAAPLVDKIGHLIFGLLRGRRLLSVKMWRIELFRSPSEWRFRRTRGGGFASIVMVARDPAEIIAGARFFIIGGPVTSLVAALVALLLAWHFEAGDPVSMWWWTLFGVASCCQALAELVPRMNGPYPSDGLWLRRFKAEVAPSQLALGTAKTYRANGFGIDAVEVWIDEALRAPNETIARYDACVYGYNAACTKGQFDRAERLLLDAIALRHLVPNGVRGNILREGAFFIAVHKQAYAEAKELFAESEGLPETFKGEAIRAEAAVRYLAGDHTGATVAARLALEQFGPRLCDYHRTALARIASGSWPKPEVPAMTAHDSVEK